VTEYIVKIGFANAARDARIAWWRAVKAAA